VRRAFVLVAVLMGSLPALPAAGSGRTASFSGSCKFAGPIEPTPPITAVPKPGAHFSYSGSGSCTGSIPGPITVRFTNVSTTFDTCEFGPDFGLNGTMTIGSGSRRALFQITINLPRLALAGPFSLSAAGGGRAVGVAQFEPPSQSTAPQQCASGGIGSASLSASFNTVSALVGTADPVQPSASAPRRHRSRRDRQRPTSCSHRRKCPCRGARVD